MPRSRLVELEDADAQLAQMHNTQQQHGPRRLPRQGGLRWAERYLMIQVCSSLHVVCGKMDVGAAEVASTTLSSPPATTNELALLTGRTRRNDDGVAGASLFIVCGRVGGCQGEGRWALPRRPC